MISGLNSILGLIAGSGVLESAVKAVTKKIQNKKESVSDLEEIKKILELQSELNEKLESRINVIESAIFKTQKILRSILVISIIAVVFSICAILIIFFK